MSRHGVASLSRKTGGRSDDASGDMSGGDASDEGASDDDSVEVKIPFGNINRARHALLTLEQCAKLGLVVLAQASTHGEDEVLNGLRQVFQATARLIE